MSSEAPIKVSVSRGSLEGNFYAFDLQIYTLMTIAREARLRNEKQIMNVCVSWARAANWKRRYVYQILRRSGGELPRSLRPQRVFS